jgi:dihydropteroate synthase
MTKFPQIMGIVNATPDSFSDGGKYNSHETAYQHAIALLEQGADIIDIGGESTRPGAADVDPKDEQERVVPVISMIKKEIPNCLISVDTTKYEVARAALDAGAEIINDISGLEFDPHLADLAAEYNAKLVIMHIQGKPRTMQSAPEYKDVVENILELLKQKIEFARSRGAKKIIADVGIGFGKTLEHNLELLRRHKEFSQLGVPMLLGISRKSFIGKLLDIDDPSQRDLPTALIHSLMLNSGADILRVHNVEIIAMLRKLAKELGIAE